MDENVNIFKEYGCPTCGKKSDEPMLIKIEGISGEIEVDACPYCKSPICAYGVS